MAGEKRGPDVRAKTILFSQAPGYLRLFYSAQLGVWFYTAFSHRFVEQRRKDYMVMCASASAAGKRI